MPRKTGASPCGKNPSEPGFNEAAARCRGKPDELVRDEASVFKLQ